MRPLGVRAGVPLAALAMLFALLGVVVPATAQPNPGISLTPTEAAAGPSTERWSIVVQGQNWSPGTITLQFDGQTVGSATPRSDGTFAATITPTKRNAGTYLVTALQNPCGPSSVCTVGRQASFRAIPQLELSPTCHRPGTTSVIVNGRWFQEDNSATVTYGWPSTSNTMTTGTDSPNGNFTVTFNGVNPSGDVQIRATDSRQNVGQAVWSLCPPPTTTTSTTSTTTPVVIDTTTTTRPGDDPVPDPTTSTTRPPVDIPGTPVTIPPTIDLPPPTPGATLTVTPELGPAGFVTTAVGTGYPPGAVTLMWSPGIGTTTAIVEPDGTFTASVLIFPNDRLGPRALIAVGGATTAFDAFLVVQSSVQPSGQDVQQINRIRRFNSR